jgi:hypothetical protein
MRRFIIGCLAATAIALAGFAGSAAASGPGGQGRDIIELTCGSETLTVSVPPAEDSNGVGQIVGHKGHGIPITFEFSVFDVTTNTLLFSEAGAVGGGHAHPNQATTSCTAVVFEATAADFFGPDPLPPGVAPTDIIRASIAVDVILKL